MGVTGRFRLLLALPFAVLVLVPASALASARIFTFSGGEQAFTVPAGVSQLQLIAVGAGGGKGFDDTPGIGGVGGFGARVSGRLAVTPGQVFFVEVGGSGLSGAAGGGGGFNGGGNGGTGDCAGFGSCPAGGGGGATDLRTCSVAAASCAGASSSLNSRVLVAAGGGGGGTGNGAPYTGGAGGGGATDGHQGQPTSGGCVGGAGGKAGTSSAGGAGGAQTTCSGSANGNQGSLGQGASNGNQGFPGGGGGGGLYGGGGGGGGNGSSAGGGGGGSNFFGALIGASATTDATGTPMLAIIPGPGVTSINPASGSIAGGQSVTITGHDFTGATAVSFGGVNAKSFTVNADGQITAVSPEASAPGSLDVRVTTPVGTTPIEAGDRFTYTACVVPDVRHKKLKGAKKLLRRADCKLGKVKGHSGKKTRVKKQKPKPGTILLPGSKVKLTTK